MNSEHEDFETLRQLLALKRHEVPPPRYFSELPGQIWARIEREPAALSFWQRIFPSVGLSPALAYSFGLLACGTLFFGVAYTLKTDPGQTAARPFAIESSPLDSPTLASGKGLGFNLTPSQSVLLASTNPVMNAEALPSLFDGPPLRMQLINHSPGQ